MAASSSSSCTRQQWHSFHNIDRAIYSRLVIGLKRDPAESMQVMALWLWLEQSGHDPDFIFCLRSVDDLVLDTLADEAVEILKCIEKDDITSALENDSDILVTHMYTRNSATLRFFHDNRISALRAVMRNVHGFCMKAVGDIYSKVSGPVMGPTSPGVHVVDGANQFLPRNYGGDEELLRAFDPYDLAYQRELLGGSLCDILNGLDINCGEKEVKEEAIIPIDDRAIFLTFSRGHPISKNEVRWFFTEKFGQCVEDIYMEDWSPNKQALHATLVFQQHSTVEAVLDGKEKAKFNINGKEAWATKVAKKTTGPRPSSQPALPLSFSAAPQH